MSEEYIDIQGARVHNLKNINVKIPHNKFTVITGLSGSGKSSLAFDTLYAEGQRRYIESISSYARQFLGKLDKPEVDYIKGVSPAIAIEQKVSTANTRSTVGTSTEIYDFLKVLFSRAGTTISPISGQEVKKHTVKDVVDFIKTLPDGERVLILCKLEGFIKYGSEKQIRILKEQGYARLYLNDEFLPIEECLENLPENIDQALLVVDRIQHHAQDNESYNRIADSVQLAFSEGHGECLVKIPSSNTTVEFSNLFELDGMQFQEPNEHFFTFNNPFGACKKCEGFGQVIGIDEHLVIPNRELSIYSGAVSPWSGDKMSEYLNKFIQQSAQFDFPIHRPVSELSADEYSLLWNGTKGLKGINDFFKFVESKAYKIQYRVLLSRYRGRTKCPDCKGTRLRKDAGYVLIGGKNIFDVVLSTIDENIAFFNELDHGSLNDQIKKRILPEITSRLQFLHDVGLGYLTLNRSSSSLSGGESQRINLATSLGSSLVGSTYILDEPSIGLHPKDTEKLIGILYKLRDLGNTVIVVEHEEDIMRAADEILDIGPFAGSEGGTVVFQGTHKDLLESNNSLTADYLTERKRIDIPTKRRSSKDKLTIKGARQHNLKNVSVDFPLHSIVCVTGVSGSGKSSLVREILLPAVRKELEIYSDKQGDFGKLVGDFKHVQAVEFIDQNPIGKSSRSNPVTYIKAFDDIRSLFASQPLAKSRGYTAGFFSFNVDGGRCEVCEGEGEIVVSMQFMADVHLPCEHCKNTRYKTETLDVEYRGKSISDILSITIDEAFEFFSESEGRVEKKIADKLEPLVKVGLGYLQMGQASSTLSGGEAQRIKLASFLAKGSNSKPTLFIFDEPTVGLHFHDVKKLLIAFNELVNSGHSIIIIEHNLDVIKCADHIIDIGPEGGDQGGNIVFSGTPEDLVKCSSSYTGAYLKEKLINL